MTFSARAKAELCRVPIKKRCCAVAEAYGVLLYCSQFSSRELRIVTASEDFAERLPRLFRGRRPRGQEPLFRLGYG